MEAWGEAEEEVPSNAWKCRCSGAQLQIDRIVASNQMLAHHMIHRTQPQKETYTLDSGMGGREGGCSYCATTSSASASASMCGASESKPAIAVSKYGSSLGHFGIICNPTANSLVLSVSQLSWIVRLGLEGLNRLVLNRRDGRSESAMQIL